MTYVFRRGVAEVEQWLMYNRPIPFPWPRRMTDDESKDAYYAGLTRGERPWYVGMPTEKELEMALRFIDWMNIRGTHQRDPPGTYRLSPADEAALFERLAKENGLENYKYDYVYNHDRHTLHPPPQD